MLSIPVTSATPCAFRPETGRRGHRFRPPRRPCGATRPPLTTRPRTPTGAPPRSRRPPRVGLPSLGRRSHPQPHGPVVDAVEAGPTWLRGRPTRRRSTPSATGARGPGHRNHRRGAYADRRALRSRIRGVRSCATALMGNAPPGPCGPQRVGDGESPAPAPGGHHPRAAGRTAVGPVEPAGTHRYGQRSGRHRAASRVVPRVRPSRRHAYADRGRHGNRTAPPSSESPPPPTSPPRSGRSSTCGTGLDAFADLGRDARPRPPSSPSTTAPPSRPAAPTTATCWPGSSRTSSPATGRCAATGSSAASDGTPTASPSRWRSRTTSGLSGPAEIEAYGVDKFNEACRARVMANTEVWEAITRRIGRWVDFENDYSTMDVDFMESVWWVFRQLWDKGLDLPGLQGAPLLVRRRHAAVQLRGEPGGLPRCRGPLHHRPPRRSPRAPVRSSPAIGC